MKRDTEHMKREINAPPTSSSGQAIVEFIVALVAVLALTAGLIQLVSLSQAQTDTMIEARREAAALATLDAGGLGVLSSADYIQDWDEGGDGKRHSADDVSQPASPVPFTQNIVEKAAPDETGWTVLDQAPEDRLTQLRGNPMPASVFGLVRGSDDTTVPIIPAVRSLIYRADTVEISSDVWMTRLGGIY